MKRRARRLRLACVRVHARRRHARRRHATAWRPAYSTNLCWCRGVYPRCYCCCCRYRPEHTFFERVQSTYVNEAGEIAVTEIPVNMGNMGGVGNRASVVMDEGDLDGEQEC